MTAQEREVLQLFRRLNETGQEEALHLLQWYTTKTEYIRTGPAQIIPFRTNAAQGGDIPRSRHA